MLQGFFFIPALVYVASIPCLSRAELVQTPPRCVWVLWVLPWSSSRRELGSWGQAVPFPPPFLLWQSPSCCLSTAKEENDQNQGLGLFPKKRAASFGKTLIPLHLQGLGESGFSHSWVTNSLNGALSFPPWLNEEDLHSQVLAEAETLQSRASVLRKIKLTSILGHVRLCRSGRSRHGQFLRFLWKVAVAVTLVPVPPLQSGRDPELQLCVSMLGVPFSALAHFPAPSEHWLAGCWWEFLWTGKIAVISLDSKTDSVTSQCTVAPVSLLPGKAVLQAVELCLVKFFQGKIKKDEQEVLIASNWEEEIKSSSAATSSRAAQAEPSGTRSSSGVHREGQRRSCRSCGIPPSSSLTCRSLPSCLICCFQSAQATVCCPYVTSVERAP